MPVGEADPIGKGVGHKCTGHDGHIDAAEGASVG